MLDTETAVRERYSAGAMKREEALCCPVTYDPRYLEVIPDDVLSRDYGCGDPTQHVREGDVVLDLGSGGGKACFIASQIVGERGRVIGVDVNPDMLGLARRYVGAVGERIGYHNVEFRHGAIEDLALDLDALDAWLLRHPVTALAGLTALETEKTRLRREQPLIPDQSVDVVVSNCVLNLVEPSRKPALFPEIFRVLKPGGRAVISDIVADEPVPESLRSDPELWSGCIAGALTESEFLQAFERAGFYGIQMLAWTTEPWKTVDGIQFRSLTVQAWRGKEGPCFESNKAVVYHGPWKRVVDDDGHVFHRGRREAVCEKTFGLMMRPPYAGQLSPVLPLEEIPASDQAPFDCARTAPRDPRETKGLDYAATADGGCADGSCC